MKDYDTKGIKMNDCGIVAELADLMNEFDTLGKRAEKIRERQSKIAELIETDLQILREAREQTLEEGSQILLYSELPAHLIRLERAVIKQGNLDLGGEGWTNETLENFIIHWCNKYDGEYAAEDVVNALRTWSIDPQFLSDAAKRVAEKRGGTPIYEQEKRT